MQQVNSHNAVTSLTIPTLFKTSVINYLQGTLGSKANLSTGHMPSDGKVIPSRPLKRRIGETFDVPLQIKCEIDPENYFVGVSNDSLFFLNYKFIFFIILILV